MSFRKRWIRTGMTEITTWALGVTDPAALTELECLSLRCRMRNTNYYQDLFSQRKFCSLEGMWGMPSMPPGFLACLHTASKSTFANWIEFIEPLGFQHIAPQCTVQYYIAYPSCMGKKIAHTLKFSPKAFFACEVDSGHAWVYSSLFAKLSWGAAWMLPKVFLPCSHYRAFILYMLCLVLCEFLSFCNRALSPQCQCVLYSILLCSVAHSSHIVLLYLHKAKHGIHYFYYLSEHHNVSINACISKYICNLSVWKNHRMAKRG